VASRRVYGMVEQLGRGAPIDDLVLKGFNHPVSPWRSCAGARKSRTSSTPRGGAARRSQGE